jgi:hypothetical protein
MMRPTQQRLAKLEARHRPVLDRRSKAERDAAVAMALADPEWFHQIGVELLGGEQPGDREHHAAILAAWRADT